LWIIFLKKSAQDQSGDEIRSRLALMWIIMVSGRPGIFQMVSQATVLYLMVELPEVVCKAQQHPFRCHMDRSTQHEPPEVHVFLD